MARKTKCNSWNGRNFLLTRSGVSMIVVLPRFSGAVYSVPTVNAVSRQLFYAEGDHYTG